MAGWATADILISWPHQKQKQTVVRRAVEQSQQPANAKAQEGEADASKASHASVVVLVQHDRDTGWRCTKAMAGQAAPFAVFH